MNKDGKILLATMATGFIVLGGGLLVVNQKAETPRVVVEKQMEVVTPTATPSAILTPARAVKTVAVTPTKVPVVTKSPVVK